MDTIPLPDRYTGLASQEAQPYVTTHHGIKIAFLDLRPSMIRAHDMAWHLGRTCRYAGMTHQWYSNAEHSFLGMQLCESHEAKRHFLIHDVGEMVTGDVPYPFKRLCPDYKKLCDLVQENMNEVLCGSRHLHEEVKRIDYLLTATEQHHLRGQPDDQLFVEPLKNFHFPCWTWDVAMFNWMRAFKLYYPEFIY